MTATDPDPTADAPAFPMRRGCPFGPPDDYARLRERSRVARVTMPNGARPWVATHYEDVRALLTDARISSDVRRPGFPSLRPEDDGTGSGSATRSFIEMDEPEHGVRRRMLIPEFTVKRIKELRDKIQQHVDRYVDDILRQDPPIDLVAEFSLPVPSVMICELIGVPFSDHDFFQSRTEALLEGSSTPEEVTTAFGEFYGYLVDLIARTRADPSDDLIGRLIVEQVDAGRLTDEELISNLLLLLLAGHETTANMISLGLYTLLRHPEQAEQIRRTPALLAGAVDELLRLHSIGDVATFRVAAADIEVGGRRIREGEGVIPLIGAANHDRDAFDDPATFDIHRRNRHHVAFGFGAHQCIAQNLARATLEVAYGTVLTRIPTLELAVAPEKVPFKYEASTFGIEALPVRW